MYKLHSKNKNIILILFNMKEITIFNLQILTKMRLNIVLAVICLGFIACENKIGIPPKITTTPVAPNMCDSIRYNNGIKSIIDNNCANSCHNSSIPSGGIDLSTYNLAKIKALDGRIHARINDAMNPMPQAGLMPQNKIDSLECWINKGAPL